jgi:Protein of unknown function (Hypoth_ymh)
MLERIVKFQTMRSKRKSTETRPIDNPAGIEYVGIAGISKDCQDAVLQLIQFGTRITEVRILSAKSRHCLLLTRDGGDEVAVKSGFATGYGGEGPRRFSYVLQILDSHGAEIIEHDVPRSLLEKIDDSALTKSDFKKIKKTRHVRPSRWHDYVSERDFERAREGTLWREEFPAVIPFALIDARIMDLARDFWNSPDNSLLVGYRRLEDIVRERTATKNHGTKLFSQAFNPGDGALTWEQADDGERAGRMQLFTGTYGAHRNLRAHKEVKTHSEELLGEFLLLNHLYCLERDAIDVGEIRSQPEHSH